MRGGRRGAPETAQHALLRCAQLHWPPRTRFFHDKPPLVVPMMVPEAPELNESVYMSPPTAQAVVPLATATLRRV